MDWKEITIHKLDINHVETWRYTGQIITLDTNRIVLEARFNRPDTPFHDIWLKYNDRFIETFYSDRWYNIFEIHDRDSDEIKCWYCNVGYPAVFEDGGLSYRDLAIDLLVYPSGVQLVLDEDEFALLPISDDIRKMACESLQTLKVLFSILPPAL
jgi:protein associated with RNAse G/E